MYITHPQAGASSTCKACHGQNRGKQKNVNIRPKQRTMNENGGKIYKFCENRGNKQYASLTYGEWTPPGLLLGGSSDPSTCIKESGNGDLNRMH